MRTAQCYACIGLFGALVLGAPAASHAQWASYDDFSAGSIDPEKWEESFAFGGPSNPTTELAAFVEASKLQLGVTQYGLANTSIGTSGGQARLSAIAAN